MEEEHDSLSARRKKSSVGIICCFTGASQHHRRASLDATYYSSPRRSPSAWFKSRTNDLPEIKGKCRSFISRIARHRRHSSADFSYDPLSYALNFDDDASSSVAEDDFRALSFSARLPASPPRRNATPPPIPRSSEEPGSEDLRRGFEALSASLKATSPLGGQRRSSNKATEPPEDVTNPVDISSNREILVQLCSI